MTSLLIIIVLLGYALFFRQSESKDKNIATNKTEMSKTVGSQKLAIDELTSENIVVPYVKENKQLPEYYITKETARNGGWIASEGNLCEVLPGKAIGGDIFTNREKSLPVKKGRIWYEADLNYNCGRRNADRLVFSSDGLIFVTYDHYKTFDKR